MTQPHKTSKTITPKQQAKLLLKQLGDKKCVLIMVNKLISVTAPDHYPRKKTERDRQYWEAVKIELK